MGDDRLPAPVDRDQDPAREPTEPSRATDADPDTGPGVRPAAPSGDAAPPARAGLGVQRLLAQAGLEGDKAVVVGVAVALAVGLGVVALVVLTRQPPAQPRIIDYTPHLELGMSAEEELRSFTSKTAKQVTELGATLDRLNAAMDGLIKRQDDTETLVRSTLKSATDTFSAAGQAKVEQMAAFAAAARAEDPRTTRIIDEFRTSLTSLKESPSEARARAALLLRQAGVGEGRIENLLAEAAQQAGRLDVGEIAEPPLSPAEIRSLPEWVQPLAGSLHDQVYALGQVQGRFYPEQALDDLRIILRAHAHSQVVDAALLARIAQVVRIRRENLTPELGALLPGLIAQRERQGLDRDDHAAIAHLVWASRARFPLATTAGQMLSLCEEVARTIGAVAAPDAAPAPPGGAENDGPDGFRPLDASTEPFAVQVVQAAVVEARAFGRDQEAQRAIAGRALRAYLDTMRMTASAEQQTAIVRQALAGAQAASAAAGGGVGTGAGTGPGDPAAARAAPPAPSTPSAASAAAVGGAQADGTAPPAVGALHPDPERLLYCGPVRLAADQAGQALLWCLPGIVSADGYRLESTVGAAALVGALEQVPRLVAAHLEPELGKPLGGLSFLQAALPELMQEVHLGASLGRIALPVSPGGAEEHDAAAALMRGVAIGAIYGPLLHDAAKATAAAPDALAALEASPPLTPELAAELGPLCSAQPLVAIARALAALRPGAWDYPGPRAAAIGAGIIQLQSEAQTLQQSLAGEVVPGQAGALAEHLRLVIPLAVASHDDRTGPVPELIRLVQQDLTAYATRFLSEGRLSHAVMEELVPRYATAMSEEAGGGTALVEEAAAGIPAVLDGLSAQLPAPERGQITSRVAQLVARGLPLVELDLVRFVVLARVLPRLQAEGATGDPAAVREAAELVRSRVAEVVDPPYTPARIDGWAAALSGAGLDHLHGRTPAAPVAVHAGPAVRTLWPAVTMLATSPAGALVGGVSTTVRGRHLVLPANTYGDAHLQTGVDAEIGGRGNLPVMLQLDLVWEGPAGSRIPMRGCRVSGVANALAGPQRVAIDLKSLSYVFPSGRELDCEIHGYVADNLTGQYGALGTYHWNADKVLPMAVVAGGFKGAADTLKAGTSTTIVGTAGQATVAASEGSQLQQAGYGAVSGGFGIMSDYVQAVLNQVHPSVSAVNGQSVSVVLLDAVEITVPESDIADLTDPHAGFAP